MEWVPPDMAIRHCKRHGYSIACNCLHTDRTQSCDQVCDDLQAVLYFDGSTCPDCSDSGTTVLTADRRTRLSKFTSGALRHFPANAGLSLDERGWTAYAALVDAVTAKYDWADAEAAAGVIATDPKDGSSATGRFPTCRITEQRPKTSTASCGAA